MTLSIFIINPRNPIDLLVSTMSFPEEVFRLSSICRACIRNCRDWSTFDAHRALLYFDLQKSLWLFNISKRRSIVSMKISVCSLFSKPGMSIRRQSLMLLATVLLKVCVANLTFITCRLKWMCALVNLFPDTKPSLDCTSCKLTINDHLMDSSSIWKLFKAHNAFRTFFMQWDGSKMTKIFLSGLVP